MKKARYILLAIILFVVYQSNAQTVLLNYDSKTEPSYNRGPNQKKFTQGYLIVGFITPPDQDGANLVYGSSATYGFGIRKKFKVSPVYSLGWDLKFDFTYYKIKQTANKKFSPGTTYDSQRLDVSSVSLGLFNRFNFDPHRGNFMGTYFDIAADVRYAYSILEIFKYKTTVGDVRTELSNLNYVKNLHSDLIARFGYSRICLWSSYRFTDLFKPQYNLPEMPRLTIGLELGLY